MRSFTHLGKWLTVATISTLIWVAGQIPDGKLHVIFCDVGQGDAELIVKGRVQILVDGGPKADRVLDCLAAHMPFWDRNLEMIVNSHPHADHVGGLPEV